MSNIGKKVSSSDLFESQTMKWGYVIRTWKLGTRKWVRFEESSHRQIFSETSCLSLYSPSTGFTPKSLPRQCNCNVCLRHTMRLIRNKNKYATGNNDSLPNIWTSLHQWKGNICIMWMILWEQHYYYDIFSAITVMTMSKIGPKFFSAGQILSSCGKKVWKFMFFVVAREWWNLELSVDI